MAPIVVYRFQHTDGKGPWSSSSGKCIGWGLKINAMPGPWEDAVRAGCEYRQVDNPTYAAPSIQYFSYSDMCRLRRHGYRLHRFMIPPARNAFAILDTQIVFNRTLAERIEA